jgi:hypothetical protein
MFWTPTQELSIVDRDFVEVEHHRNFVDWHSSLVYVYLSCIQLLLSQGHLGSVSFQNFNCMSCHLGKQSHLPLIEVTFFLDTFRPCSL